jgi:pimeloyl-ACP methyl ester carboxylesterase
MLHKNKEHSPVLMLRRPKPDLNKRKKVSMKHNNLFVLILVLLILNTACAGHTLSPTPSNSNPWMEEQVSFSYGQDELYGILTLPTSKGPYPAVVIISGSVNPNTGVRDGVSAQIHVDLARKMVPNGFAVLRYDPPGVGQSTGKSGFESLDSRTEESIAALHYLQSRKDIQPERVGLWSDSQGCWVIAMAAAGFPQDVAFTISVSGSGVPVAEQQIYSIEAQSKADGMSESDITKAVLFGRLLLDWQFTTPVYREVNEADARSLGDGPWNGFMALVYEPGGFTLAEGLQAGIGILKSIQDEPWAKFLYLKQLYIPQLESIPPEQVTALKANAGQNLLNDPKKYLTKVRSPVLAFFGEEDVLQPAEKSAALYKQYLTEAGNINYKIVVIPGVGHSSIISTTAYWETLSDWLDHLYS